MQSEKRYQVVRNSNGKFDVFQPGVGKPLASFDMETEAQQMCAHQRENAEIDGERS